MAGTYNINTYNSALYNAGRDDRGAIIRSIIQAHTGPHIQAVVGADPRLPANQSGVSFITDFTIIEGTVRKPPLCYNFPDLKAVMRVMQVGSLDLDATIFAQRFFDMPACTYPVAFLPELRAFIFAFIEQDLGADIFGILAQLDLGAIIQIVQEDLGGFILGIAAPNLPGRIFSQLAPNLGAIIWSPVDLPASIISVVFSDLQGDIFAFNFGDMPAKMLGIAAPQLFARIKGFAAATADLPAIMSSRLEELMNAKITALYPGPNDLLATIDDISTGEGNLGSKIKGPIGAGVASDLVARIGFPLVFEDNEFDLQARINFLSAITLAASMGALPLGIFDRFLAGTLQPVHAASISASIESNENLKNLSAAIFALSGTADLPAFLRAAETFVTAILTVSTLNAFDLRATIGNPACAGGSANAVLNAFANAQHAKDMGGFIQSFVENNLGATINLKEIFYAMDTIGVTFSPRADRPVIFQATDTIPVTFSPFRGLNLGAVITAGQPRIDLLATIQPIILLPRVDPSVGRLTAAELRPDREFDVQELRFQMEGELLDYFYVNGTDDAFIADGTKDWKINIRSFREIAAGLFGEFAAGRVCRLGGLTSYATLDEAVRNCIAVVLGEDGEFDMSANIFVSGGTSALPATLSVSDTFGDMNALVNRVFPVDLGAVIGLSPSSTLTLQGIIEGQKSATSTLSAFIALSNQGNISALVGAAGGVGNLSAKIPLIYQFRSLAAVLQVFSNKHALHVNPDPGDTSYVAGPALSDMGITESTDEFTCSFWIRNERSNITKSSVESLAGASSDFSTLVDGFGFFWLNQTTIRFWFNQFNIYFINGTVDSDLPYLHLVGGFDGTNLFFYINGELQGSFNFGVTIGPGDPNFEIGRVGNNSPIADRYTHGHFEDVAVWSRGLSQNEILDVFNYGLGKLDLSIAGLFYTPTDLKLWWDMDETVIQESYPVIKDRSGFSHDGTFVDGPVDPDDALVGVLPALNNVSIDFTANDTYYRTTTGDNGVPVNGTGDFSVLVTCRTGSNGFDICVAAWNSAQTVGNDAAFRIKRHSSPFNTNGAVMDENSIVRFADLIPGVTDPTGTVWYNWIVTFEESSGLVRAYNDGVLITTTAALPGARKDWSEFLIGATRWQNNINDWWQAEIDTVAVWDTVLTQDDIDVIWNSGESEVNLKTSGPIDNLAAWYRLGEAGDSVTLLQDKSGNGHHMVRFGSNTTIVTNVPN